MEVAKTLYGPRKLGAEKFALQQARQKASTRGATVYGPRKGGGLRRGDPQHVEDESIEHVNPYLDEGGDRVTLSTLKERLSADPDSLDVAIETEIAHPEGARKGALELFLKLEREREGGARPGLVKLLEDQLTDEE